MGLVEKKKGFFKTIYEKTKGKIEVPWLEPTPEQNYQTIDTVFEEIE